jgi:hypothetical protein
MGKKQRTPAQLAADKARSEQMKAKLAQTIEDRKKGTTRRNRHRAGY